MERVPPPRLLFSQFTLSLNRWKAQGGLVLLYGGHAVLAYSLRAVASLLASGQHVVFIDSANAFDPFLISEVATGWGRRPEELLDRIHVSRTFTVHQLEALITERLSDALKTYTSRVLVASGFLNNLYDEDVELREVWRIFREATAHLRALADSGALVLVVCPNPGARGEPGRTMRLRDRNGMLDALMAEADKVIKLEPAGLYLEKSVKATDTFGGARALARSGPKRTS
jgi:hypothetical protein